MIYVCQACKGETHSQSNRMKPSTCDDCYAEIDFLSGLMKCACHDVEHDKDKIPKTKPMSKSLESEMKVLIGDDEEKINKDRSSDAKV